MKFLILRSVILLSCLFSCTGGDGGGSENRLTAVWYQELAKTSDDNLRLALYSKIIETDPQDSYAYYARADIYKNLGKYDEAIKDFTRAMRVDDPYRAPTMQEIYCSRGDVYALLGKHYAAIEDYNEAILIAPKFSRAYESRANVYTKLDKQDEASRDRQTATELSSDDNDVVSKE